MQLKEHEEIIFMNVPLSAVAGDFKVHRSGFTVGLQIEAENVAVCMQTNEASGGYWTEMRPSSYLLLLVFLSLQHL